MESVRQGARGPGGGEKRARPPLAAGGGIWYSNSRNIPRRPGKERRRKDG